MAGLEIAKEIVSGYHGKKLRIMEVCGTHTHEIFRLGIRQLLSQDIELISGPGCPVCVTPAGFIDEAILLALEHHVTICTFGDLVRVPGTKMSLEEAKAEGAKVKIVYAPLDAAVYAKENPAEQVCFLAVGFETTTPGSCIAVQEAVKWKLTNFSLLTANKIMPPAYEAMKDSCDLYLYPGHVHAVTGTKICEDLVKKGISGVVAGFTPRELLTALAVAVKKSQENEPFFVNCYPRVVHDAGSAEAKRLIAEMLEPCTTEWRGLGEIGASGMRLQDKYAAFDARKKFVLPFIKGQTNPSCHCGDVLQGKCKPPECPLFGKVCTPGHPVGACMVSSEGACAAFYKYGGYATSWVKN